jgi:hypothetical protein
MPRTITELLAEQASTVSTTIYMSRLEATAIAAQLAPLVGQIRVDVAFAALYPGKGITILEPAPTAPTTTTGTTT